MTGGIYELDGNTGFTAAVAEMLVQGYNGVVRILPALPAEWKQGEVKGMRVYGGHQISAKWDEHTVTGEILANSDTELKIRCFGVEQEISVKKGENYPFSFARR